MEWSFSLLRSFSARVFLQQVTDRKKRARALTGAAEIAKVLFFIFLVLFIVSLILGLFRRGS